MMAYNFFGTNRGQQLLRDKREEEKDPLKAISKNLQYVKVFTVLTLKRLTYKKELMVDYNVKKADIERAILLMERLGFVEYKRLGELKDVYFYALKTSCDIKKIEKDEQLYLFPKDRMQEATEILKDWTNNDTMKSLIEKAAVKTNDFKVLIAREIAKEKTKHTMLEVSPEGIVYERKTNKTRTFENSIKEALLELKKEGTIKRIE